MSLVRQSHQQCASAFNRANIASEHLNGESGWHMLAPGELVHVRPDLSVYSRIAIPQPPTHPVPLPAGSPNIDT